MTDADVIDHVLGVLQSTTDWPAEHMGADLGDVRVAVEQTPEDPLVRWVLLFEQWDPDEYEEEGLWYEEMEEFAKPRIESLQTLFQERIDATWQPGAIEIEDDGAPLTEGKAWHNDRFTVEIGSLLYDNGLPVMVVLRARNNPK